MPEDRTVVKKVKNAVLFSDGSIRLENVRASYPNVAEAREQIADDGTKSYAYSMQALMPKATHREAKDLCKAAVDKMLVDAKLKALPADRKFIKDGDTMAKDETEGQWVVSSREKNRPALRGHLKDPSTGKAMKLDPERDKSVIYGGCYVNVLIKPWFQANKYGKRANASLLAVQFLRDGEPFGEGRIREEDIDDSFDADEDDTGGFDDDNDL